MLLAVPPQQNTYDLLFSTYTAEEYLLYLHAWLSSAVLELGHVMDLG